MVGQLVQFQRGPLIKGINMQTFLPYPDFKKTAQILDYRRLGKERVETKQILNAIRNNNGWRHHPIVKMWTGYEQALMLYFNVISEEWVRRGYKHNMGFFDIKTSSIQMPPWMGYAPFHQSHRSNLLRKNYDHYVEYFGNIPTNLPYLWYKNEMWY